MANNRIKINKEYNMLREFRAVSKFPQIHRLFIKVFGIQTGTKLFNVFLKALNNPHLYYPVAFVRNNTFNTVNEEQHILINQFFRFSFLFDRIPKTDPFYIRAREPGKKYYEYATQWEKYVSDMKFTSVEKQAIALEMLTFYRNYSNKYRAIMKII